jgi:uncharacterized protein YndB with AHSA1/START domain
MSQRTADVAQRIQKNIELNAPVARVWRALTDYREFGAWFRVRLEGPFVVGQVSRGWITHPGYEHVRWEALVQKMEHERLFSFTWPHARSLDKAHYSPDYTGAPRTLVEFTLESTAAGTLLTVTESGFEQLSPEHRLEAFRGNERGWSEQMTNIERHVARRE